MGGFVDFVFFKKILEAHLSFI